MGYRSPEVESAPQFSIKSYPQPYPQVRPDRADRLTGQQQTPPLVKSDRSGIYTPQQKIFAKVKAGSSL
jgi:hypothetical protein